MASAITNFKLGAALWILGIQYYIAQLIVALGWPTGYSWRNNTISDLGNTNCGPYNGLFVCSPRHTLMNISFVLLGITIIGGAYYLGQHYRNERFAIICFGCMFLAGIGTIMVGIFPENGATLPHIIGAALPFFFGNLGLIIIGKFCVGLPRWIRLYGVILGGLAFLGLLLFLLRVDLVFGVGGLERIAAYPQTLWMILAGLQQLILQNRKNVS